MNTELDNSTAHYPISTVSALTGINPVTLRAWERRYGLIQPHRTDKGSFSFTQAVQELISLILQPIPAAQGEGILPTWGRKGAWQ